MSTTSEIEAAVERMPLPEQDIQLASLPHGLCTSVYLPRPIHSREEYAAAEKVADIMAGFEERMTEDQSDYFDVLTDFMSDYDEANRPYDPNVSGLALLRAIVEDNGLSAANISRILGASERSLGTKILKGARRITADHARRLGEHFKLEAGAFL